MKDEKRMVVRPTSGSPSLRKNATIRLEGGAIVATDRRRRSRSFLIDGTDTSPRGFRGTGQLDGRHYLEDQRGRALVRLDLMDWDPEELGDLEDAAGFKVVTDPGTPSDRPEMMKIEDPPYFAWAGVSAAVGTAAVSLYWLHIAPEAVMLLVALPALILFVWFVTLTKLSMPSGKEIASDGEEAQRRWLRKPSPRRTRSLNGTGSSRRTNPRPTSRMTGEDGKPFTVRPSDGSAASQACLHSFGGRRDSRHRPRGRSRTFPIDGTVDSPRGFRAAERLDAGGYYLEDRRGRGRAVGRLGAGVRV